MNKQQELLESILHAMSIAQNPELSRELGRVYSLALAVCATKDTMVSIMPENHHEQLP